MMTILTPVRGDGNGEAVLSLGIALGRPFGGHLDVVHVHARPTDFLPFGVPMPRGMKESLLESFKKQAEGEEGRLHDLFRAFCKSHDLKEVSSVANNEPGIVTASWREEEGKQASIVAIYGRLSDLVVVAKPDRSQNLGLNTFQAALFEVGALTAVAPKREVVSVLDHVAIGWNGSVEAARAVKRALRVIVNAKKITIVSGEGDHAPQLGADALRQYLGFHDMSADTVTFKATSHDIGEKLLAKVAEIGADTLVMGAYGNEKRSEFVLGGATRHVLENADIPLLMAH
jgi:hypothetical protein